MSKKKKVVLWMGIILIVLMCLFPPTIQFSKEGPDLSLRPFYYYSFFFKAHDREIQTTKLLIQCIIVGIITLGINASISDKKPKDKKPEDEQIIDKPD